MSDIVEKLRADGAMPAGFGPRAIQREAADEIERLRAECQRLAGEVSRAHKDALTWMERATAARREGIEAAADEAGKLAHGLTPDLNNYEAGYANGALDCERVIRALLGDGR